MKKKAIIIVTLLVAALLTSAFTVTALRASRAEKTSQTGEKDPVRADNLAGTTENKPDDILSPAGPGEQAPGSALPDGSDGAEDILPGPTAPDTSTDNDLPETIPMSERETACAALAELDIMRGISETATDYALDKTLTRAEAVTFIARAEGYDYSGVDGDVVHRFTDVADWSWGSVGFAAMNDITTGVSETEFNPNGTVTGRELMCFVLRGLGYYSDFSWEDPFTLASTLGFTSLEDPTGLTPITRGETAAQIYKMLTMAPKGHGKTLITRLVESGEVDEEEVRAVGMGGYLVGLDSGTLSTGEAADLYRKDVITLKLKDMRLKSLPDVHGAIVAEGVAVVPLSSLRGAMYVDCYDAYGSAITFNGVIGTDSTLGVAFVSCSVPAPDYGEVAMDVSGEATVYPVSVKSYPCVLSGLKAMPGLPVCGPHGQFLGITTLDGLTESFEIPTGDPVELYDLNKSLWPDETPAFRPRGIDPSKPMTAVTYDDGPSKTYTGQLLDLLDQYHGVATFFEVGQMLKNCTTYLQRMEDMGCEVANHTYAHKNLRKLSSQEVVNQVESVNEIIESVLGHKAALVRCPGGNSNPTVAAAIQYPIIYWTIDTRDWESRNATKVIAHVTSDKDLNGDIILMHSTYASTVQASKTIIPYIIDQGYQLVTVSEMAYFKGYTLQNGVTYTRFK